MSEPDQTSTLLTCSECEGEVEWCSFCGEEDCGAALCYGCTIEAVGISRPSPHEHGG